MPLWDPAEFRDHSKGALWEMREWITSTRARQVYDLRVNDDCSWRALASACSRTWFGDWDGDQVVGMGLCAAAYEKLLQIGDPRATEIGDEANCPFCNIARGQDAEGVFRNEHVIAFMSLHQNPEQPGRVLVCPLRHVSQIYSLPDELAGPLLSAVRDLAVALKLAFGYEGIKVQQHNESAGGQDVWHLHFHVVPCSRSSGRRNRLVEMQMTERKELAARLRDVLPRMYGTLIVADP